jgi:O-antigen/teichoic acid export membrane protein
VLLIENAVAGAARVFYQAFAGTGRPGVVTVFETIGVVACILFMLLLVPSLGMIGAALAVLLASTLRLICTLVGLRTILGVRMPRLILGRSDIQWVMGR